MRDKIHQLERIRALRLQQRQRERAEVKAEHDRTVAAIRQLGTMKEAALAQWQAQAGAFASKGATRDARDVDSHTRIGRQIAGHVAEIEKRTNSAERVRRQKLRQLADKTKIVKAAEKACEQLQILDERLAAEEALREEIMEEMQADQVVRRDPEGFSR
jgi:hypothetical protein